LRCLIGDRDDVFIESADCNDYSGPQISDQAIS
jgi:hypothetical protein